MRRIVLGVSGGIAAYKACELLRRLQGAGHEVTVVPTAAALEFVGVGTWAALSGRPVHTSVFDDVHLVPHVKIGQEVDLVYVAPATADLLARAASGRADDLLTNVLLTAHCPIVFAPAMHTEMWLNAATQANVNTLRSRGAVVVRPDVGRLAGPDAGVGRLPDPAELFAVAAAVLEDPSTAGTRRRSGHGGPQGCRQCRRHPRAPGSGALHRQLVLRADGLGARARGGAARCGRPLGCGQCRSASSARRRGRGGEFDCRPGTSHGGRCQGRRHRDHGGGTRRLHTGRQPVRPRSRNQPTEGSS